MKKRIASLILALCMLAAMSALASCGAKTPYEVVNAANEKMRELDSYSADMKIDIGMSMSGVSVDIPMNIEMLADNVKSDKPLISAKMTMEMLGISIEMNLYSDGEMTYIDAVGQKYKTPVGESSEYDFSSYTEGVLADLPEELFEGKDFVKNDDGSQSITLEVPDEMFASLYGAFIEGINSTAGDSDVEDITISDAVVTVTVADGYITSYDISFKMNLVVSGVETDADAKAVINYRNVGEDVTVTAPENLDEYTEAEA